MNELPDFGPMLSEHRVTATRAKGNYYAGIALVIFGLIGIIAGFALSSEGLLPVYAGFGALCASWCLCAKIWLWPCHFTCFSL